MTNAQDTTPAEKDGKYQFGIHYAGREVSCKVEKEQNILHVTIDDNMSADLQLNTDGTVTHLKGAAIPESCIEYIKKQIFGHA